MEMRTGGWPSTRSWNVRCIMQSGWLGLMEPRDGNDVSRGTTSFSRTGFGGSPVEIRELAKLDHEAAVEWLLDGTGRAAKTNPPVDGLTALPPVEGMKGMTSEQKKAVQQERRNGALNLKGWWHQELLTTPSPLTERMTLFWHNHFTSSFQRVKWPALLYRQNVLLRHHAYGVFP